MQIKHKTGSVEEIHLKGFVVVSGWLEQWIE